MMTKQKLLVPAVLVTMTLMLGCAPRIGYDTKTPEPASTDFMENIEEIIKSNELSVSEEAYIINDVIDSPIVEEMRRWHTYTLEAKKEADALESSRGLWNFILKIGQFGGSGAAVAGSGIEGVDSKIGLIGGVASVLATLVDATGLTTKKLERQKDCEDLWFDRPMLDSWISAYITATGDDEDTQRIVGDFNDWTTNVRRKFEGCFSRTSAQ